MKTEITINIMAHNRTLSLWLKDTINMKMQLSQSKKGENDSHKTVRKEADECLVTRKCTLIVFWVRDLFAQKRDCLRFKMWKGKGQVYGEDILHSVLTHGSSEHTKDLKASGRSSKEACWEGLLETGGDGMSG